MISNVLFFEIDELYKGFANANGLMKIEGEKLVLQFNVKDAFVGLIKSSPKTLNIAFEHILEILETKRFFSKTPRNIKIRVSDINLFGAIPGLENLGEIKLKITHNDKMTAQAFLSYANLKISEYKLMRASGGERC